MRISVRLNAPATRLANTNFSTATLGSSTVLPALRDIADALIDDMKKEFSGPRRYKGDMASGFSRRDLTSYSVGIAQSAAHEKHIREGTAGPYKGFPGPVVEWAIFRGYSRRDAFKIANSIKSHGTSKTFTPYHPAGQRRFEYAENAIDKRKGDLDKWSRKIGGAVVDYVTTGDVWRTRDIG